MQYQLYPRLPGSFTEQRITEVSALAIGDLPDRELTADSLKAYVYSPTGGQRVSVENLIALRDALLSTAHEHGFPQAPRTKDRRSFDVTAGRLLMERMQVTTNEAARPGLWPFICCELVPELVLWRFPPSKRTYTPVERFGDSIRNTFGRLWWRTYVLETAEDWSVDSNGLQSKLGEDEIVQLMERPLMRANIALTCTVAQQFVNTVQENPGLARMDLMRDVQKRLNRLQPILCLEGLEQERLDDFVRQILTESVTSLLDNQTTVAGKRPSWWERMVQRLRGATTP